MSTLDQTELDFLEERGYTYKEELLCDSWNVFLFYKDADVVVIKRGENLRKEYDIGVELWDSSKGLEPPYNSMVVKTLDLLSFDHEVEGKFLSEDYLVTEYVDGESLSSIYGTPLFSEVERRALEQIERLQSLLYFRHNDLHNNNIICRNNFQSFVLIDFGKSIMDGEECDEH